MNGQSTNALVGPLDSDVAIQSRIFTIRGAQVILSRDLAELYDVEVKNLHRQVKRNPSRFPADFVIHIAPGEIEGLRCQNVTSTTKRVRPHWWGREWWSRLLLRRVS